MNEGYVLMQGSQKKMWAPGCENFEGKTRRKSRNKILKTLSPLLTNYLCSC